MPEPPARRDGLRQIGLCAFVLPEDRREVPEVVQQRDNARFVADRAIVRKTRGEALERRLVVTLPRLEHAQVVFEAGEQIRVPDPRRNRESAQQQFARFIEFVVPRRDMAEPTEDEPRRERVRIRVDERPRVFEVARRLREIPLRQAQFGRVAQSAREESTRKPLRSPLERLSHPAPRLAPA